MKNLQLVLLLFSPALILGIAVDVLPPVDCSAVLCARPLCANPVTPPGQCCPNCDDSNCKFEGCVNFNDQNRPRWQPDPCTTCQCDNENNQQFCAAVACRFLTEEDCFGYPVVTKPDQCCPSCDFGTPDTGCHVVPRLFSQTNITVTQSQGSLPSCSTKVRKSTCDKIGFESRGKKFRCDEASGIRVVRFGKKCPVVWGVRHDVVRCKAVADDTVPIGCDLRV